MKFIFIDSINLSRWLLKPSNVDMSECTAFISLLLVRDVEC